MIDLADLEAKARAATQGEWDLRHDYEIWQDEPEGLGWHLGEAASYENAAYIVAAQPSVVLELIERIRAADTAALTERVKTLEEALQNAEVELFEAADKFNVIHHNHPGAAADEGSKKYQAEDKAFCAELSGRMTAAARRASKALGGRNE